MQNSHVQQERIPALILGREILRNGIGNHAKDGGSLLDSPLQCCSGSLENFLRTTTLPLPICVITWEYLCNILGWQAGGPHLRLLPLWGTEGSPRPQFGQEMLYHIGTTKWYGWEYGGWYHFPTIIFYGERWTIQHAWNIQNPTIQLKFGYTNATIVTSRFLKNILL